MNAGFYVLTVRLSCLLVSCEMKRFRGLDDKLRAVPRVYLVYKGLGA